MDTASILASIDAEIAKLQQARAALAGVARHKVTVPKKGIRRRMSAEARKRIGDAQRRRWAAAKAKK